MSAKVETMAYAGAVPWHGLGVKVEEDISTEDMIEKAGFDWTVTMCPINCQVTSKTTKVISSHRALVRSSDQKVLTIAGKNWKPIQNKSMFEFLREFVRAGEMKLETTGSLRDGKDVWALVNLGNSFKLVNDDEVKGYLLISLPHEYGRSMKIMFTPIRVVCNNTLTYALNSTNMQNVFMHGHRKEFGKAAAQLAKESLGLAMTGMKDFQKAAKRLASVKYDKKQITSYVNGLFPSTSKKISKLSLSAENVISLIDKQPGAEMSKGTYWSAVNAVTYYVDHLTGRGVDSRMQSAWFGSKSRIKRKAVASALEYADAC